jgi:hypothetical protein
MTATVSDLHPPQVHYASCDRDVYGAAVMFFLELNDAAVITAGNLRNFAVGWREIRPCQCLQLRIKAAEDDARLARAAFKACVSEANADRVERASAELSRLRGMA